MPEHVSIADPNIHEPKGVAAATAGQAYVADGAGSGTWTTLATLVAAANVVYVNSTSDLPAASGGARALVADTAYVIGADITITETLTPANGCSIVGNTVFGATLKSTSASGLFVGGDASFQVTNISIGAPNGPLFNIVDTTPGTSIVSLNDFACTEYQSIGSFTSCFGVQIVGGSFLDTTNSTDGVTFSGATGWQVISVRQVVASTSSASYTGIDFDTSVAASIEVTDYSIIGVSGTKAIDGAAAGGNVAADTIGTVTACTLNGGGATPLTGISRDDFRWDFEGNAGVANTRPDVLLSMQNNATDTTIASSSSDGSNAVLIAGTWTDEGSSHYTSTTGGRATYDGERDFTTPITARLSIEPASGTNITMAAYLAINGTVITGSRSVIRGDNSDPKNISVVWQYNFTEDDYIEIYVENQTNSVDLLVSSAIIRIN